MTNTRLIDYFAEKGIITQEQARSLRVEMAKSGKTELSVLLASGLVSQRQLAKARSDIFNIPYVEFPAQSVDDTVFRQFPIEELQRIKAIPFARAGHVIKIAMENPFDMQNIQRLESYLSHIDGATKIVTYIATADDIKQVFDRNMEGLVSNEVTEALEDVKQESGISIDDKSTGSIDDVNLSKAPVARIVNTIFSYAVKSDASDIHIEPMEDKVRIRFRIHGIMLEKMTLPKGLAPSIVARVKILSNIKIDEKRIPQDGRTEIPVPTGRIDVRVSTLPTIHGEKVVMRLLDATKGTPVLETLGLRGLAYKQFREAMLSTNGIMLITGPTGSGKSTTLAATLAKLNTPEVNIITLEDPVEYQIAGVSQVQIHAEAGLTFASGLRSILRQDPDIIMVQEIRDEETAKLAVEASLTGHLVLATLHTNSAAAAIPRLVEMGIKPYLVAPALRTTMAQRLTRTVCKACKRPVLATPAQMQILHDELDKIPGFDLIAYATQLAENVHNHDKHSQLKKPVRNPDGSYSVYLYEGEGCSVCEGTGYSGRTGIYELLDINDDITEMISQKALASDIEKYAIENEGFVKMIQDGYLKALEGITTIDEVLRVSRE